MILFLHFLLSFSLDWEVISNTQDSVWPHFQTPRSSSKILHARRIFNSLLGVWKCWSNTVFCVWYIMSVTGHCIHRLSLQKVLTYLFHRDVSGKTPSSVTNIKQMIFVHVHQANGVVNWHYSVQPILRNCVTNFSLWWILGPGTKMTRLLVVKILFVDHVCFEK